MSAITTHVLDTARGRPARGVSVQLEHQAGDGSWQLVGQDVTDDDGRAAGLLPASTTPTRGSYRLTFDTGAWREQEGSVGFHPLVQVIFTVDQPAEHYHVPVLLSPYGYTTYRGS